MLQPSVNKLTITILLALSCAYTAHAKPSTVPTPTPTPSDMSSMPGMDMPGMKMPEQKATPTPTPSDMSSMPGMNMPGMTSGQMNMAMPSVANLADPMNREASGTAWNPDSSPVFGRMKMTSGGGMWMFMGTAFIRYTDVGSSRDVSVAGRGSRNKFDAPTMFMAMYSHPIGTNSQFGF
jgi:hypothetical protein